MLRIVTAVLPALMLFQLVVLMSVVSEGMFECMYHFYSCVVDWLVV